MQQFWPSHFDHSIMNAETSKSLTAQQTHCVSPFHCVSRQRLVSSPVFFCFQQYSALGAPHRTRVIETVLFAPWYPLTCDHCGPSSISQGLSTENWGCNPLVANLQKHRQPTLQLLLVYVWFNLNNLPTFLLCKSMRTRDCFWPVTKCPCPPVPLECKQHREHRSRSSRTVWFWRCNWRQKLGR